MNLKKVTSAVLIGAMLSQSLPAFAGSKDKTAPKVVAMSEQSYKGNLIKKELAKLGAKKDSGESLDKAFGDMANSLLAHNVSYEDIRNFVLLEAGPEAMIEFDGTVKQIKPDYLANMSVEEYAAILTTGLKSVDGKFAASGLTWSGCTGVVLGAVLAVTGLIVAIIGITKYESVESIRASYASERADRKSRYNRDVQNAKTRANQLQTELDVLGNKISQADRDIQLKQQTISTNKDKIILLTELKSGDATKDAEIQAKIDSLNAQNKQLESDVTQLRSDKDYFTNQIDIKQNDLRYWSDPKNVQSEIDNMTLVYNTDVQNSMDSEAHDVALVPEHQRQAPYFLIGGGAALVGGIYLIIDGAGDGGCK